MSRPTLVLLAAAFIVAGADTAAAKQTRDPDAYLRTLAAISSQAAHSARASCFSLRSGSQGAYNRCLRAAFLTAGGPASAPPASNLMPPERPERPAAGLDLDALTGPSTRRARPNLSISECPTAPGCAVVVGEYPTEELARQALDETEHRHVDDSSPFDKYVRAIMREGAQPTFLAAFTNGTREQAQTLCRAIRLAGRACEVARQARPRIVGSANGTGNSRATSSGAVISSVQIGAFSSSVIADREYAAVASRFAAYASGAHKRVQEVTAANGSTVYRTSFSGLSRDRAVAFCDALKAAGRDCVVR